MATISSLLSEHVTLQVRSVDRIFLAGYVPRLQCDGQLVRFLNDRAGGTIPSPAILGKIGRGYVEEINRFVNANEIPVVRFTKDMVKEDARRASGYPPGALPALFVPLFVTRHWLRPQTNRARCAGG